MGVMSAYSTSPFACELQGSKPGCLLKKPSEPGNNRQCYFLNSNGQIICELKYAKYLPRKDRWIVYRTFFLHQDEQIIEYAFDSELDGSREADLMSIAITRLTEGQVTARYSLYTRGEYVETLYSSSDRGTLSIAQTIWAQSQTHREYEVVGDKNSPIIFERIDGEHVQIYPV